MALEQTKNKFKLVGRVSRIGKDDAFKEGVMDKGQREGDVYRALRFGVKTSETNEITVSMWDYEPTEVFLWNSEKRKEDDKYKGERIPFGTWEEKQDELREQGYAVLQTRIGLDYDEKGKLVTKGLPSYVASLEIFEGLEDGDSVAIEGEIRYSTYTNRDGVEVESKNYTIKRLFKVKDVDFFDEKFEERSYFEQEMVFVSADEDKKEKKTYVIGRTIDYKGKFTDTQFVINYADEEGEVDKDMKKLSNGFLKQIKFGDLINVFGNTYNKVILEEVEEEEEDDNLLALGGKSKPGHAQSYVSRTYVSEMEIHGVDNWEKGKYTDDDFVVEEEDSLIADDDEGNSLGGKKKPKGSNPFDIDEDDEIGDDDLPF